MFNNVLNKIVNKYYLSIIYGPYPFYTIFLRGTPTQPGRICRGKFENLWFDLNSDESSEI